MEDRRACSPEAVLADRGWLIRLARGLVGDPAEAEDIAQETWLAASRQAEPPPRSWFRRVVRNLAGQRARGSSRRAWREREAARGEAHASHEALIGRMELHRVVTEEVMAMREPYRTTLLLRFLEDLPPAEIARRLDVPGGTVRRRLKEGLDELRERLDQRSGGDRGTWTSGLVALLRDEPPPPAPAALSAAGVGLVTPAILALVVLVGGPLLVLGGLRALEPPPGAAAPAAPGTPSTADTGPDVAPGAPVPLPGGPTGATSPSARTAGPPAVAWIEGRVDGVCVHERDLRVYACDRPLTYAAFLRDGASRPDGHPVGADGRFRVPIEADAVAFLMVAGEHAYLPRTVAAHADPPGSEAGAPDGGHRVVLRVETGAGVRGRVRDVAAGAEVRLVALTADLDPRSRASGDVFAARATTGADGAFRFPAAPVGPAFQLCAFPPDESRSATGLTVLWLEPCADRALDVELDRASRVAGVVVGPDGRPVGGARVRALLPGGWTSIAPLVAREATSAPDGRFALEGVPPSFLVEAAKAGFLDSARRFVEADGAGDLVLRLDPAAGLVGRVLLPDGGPAEGARVSARLDPAGARDPASAMRGARADATTAADGTFALRGLGEGPFRLRAEFPARAAAAVRLVDEVCGVEPRPEPWELRLAPLAVLVGRVVTTAGAPVARFDLWAARRVASMSLFADELRVAVDDPAGRFRVPDLVPGDWVVGARAPGLVSTAPVPVRLAGAPELPEYPGEPGGIVLELTDATAVSGRVVRPDGTAVPGAEVRVTGATSPWTEEQHADGSGWFEVTGLPPGTFSLAAAPGEELAPGPAVEVTVAAGERRDDLALVLPSTGDIEARVVGADGSGIGLLYAQIVEASTGAELVGRTDARGELAFTGLAPGTWRVSVAFFDAPIATEEVAGNNTVILHDGGLRTENRTVRVRAGETSRVQFRHPDSSAIEVRGTVWPGRPGENDVESGYPGGWVTFLPSQVGAPARVENAMAEAGGGFRARVPGPGTYTIEVDRSAGPSDESKVRFVRTIGPDPEALELAFPTGLIEGRVLDEHGVPLAGVRVRALLDGSSCTEELSVDRTHETFSDADGRYVLLNLRGGRHELVTGGPCTRCPAGSVQPPRVAHGAVELASGEAAAGLDLVTGRSGGTLDVHVRDAAGEPVAGATIFVRDDEGRALDRISPVVADARGIARYAWLAPGSYSVFARRGTRASAETGPFVVAAGSVVTTEVVLAPATLLWIAIEGPGGEPAFGWVAVRDERGRRVDGVHAAADHLDRYLHGAFSPHGAAVGPLVPGTYAVEVRAADGAGRATATVTVRGDETERRLALRVPD